MKEDIFVGYLQVAIFASLTALSSGAGKIRLVKDLIVFIKQT